MHQRGTAGGGWGGGGALTGGLGLSAACLRTSPLPPPAAGEWRLNPFILPYAFATDKARLFAWGRWVMVVVVVIRCVYV